MDKNICCPICGYKFEFLPDEKVCNNCSVDLKGEVYKTYDGKLLVKTLADLNKLASMK